MVSASPSSWSRGIPGFPAQTGPMGSKKHSRRDQQPEDVFCHHSRPQSHRSNTGSPRTSVLQRDLVEGSLNRNGYEDPYHGFMPGTPSVFGEKQRKEELFNGIAAASFGAICARTDIKDPKPAVYQLTKSKTSNMTVCLVTDFVSNTNVIKKDYRMFSTNTTVLDMKSTESKSNGVLAWDNTASFSCSEPFTVPFYSSSGLSCNATLVEKNFQTDWNLNFQNLLVITFRILFLKVTGFNLLMTLRLWSC